MANDCSNTLVVIGLEDPQKFARLLELALYGEVLPPGHFYAVVRKGADKPEFRFKTKWQPPVHELENLSQQLVGTRLLLSYSCWESGFRGHMVISDGEVVEHIHRLGYNGPAFLFADITHPLVSLWDANTAPTLEQQASNRLQEAIAIVGCLKKTLEDKRFTDSPYRWLGDDAKVIRTRQQLSTLLEMMNRQASEISFAGVLVTAANDESRTKD